MIIGNIFDVFSKRVKNDNKVTPISETFRNRILMLWRDTAGFEFANVIEQLHTKLTYFIGNPQLMPNNDNQSISKESDLLKFLLTCSDEHFLNAIEYSFQLQGAGQLRSREKEIIKHINEFFSVDDLPYFLTESVWEETSNAEDEAQPLASIGTSYKLLEHPKVIRKDSEVLHETAITPCLDLLRGKKYVNANHEFLSALDDFRKGKYRDSVAKASSAFESVMKVICKTNKYPYKESDTFSPLLKLILERSELDSFWTQPLTIVASVRNKLSYSHGAGNKERHVPQHVAQYVLNATASAIILLVQESN